MRQPSISSVNPIAGDGGVCLSLDDELHLAEHNKQKRVSQLKHVSEARRMLVGVVGFSRLDEEIPGPRAPRLVIMASETAKETTTFSDDGSKQVVRHPDAPRSIGYLLSAPRGSDVDLGWFASELKAESLATFERFGEIASLPALIGQYGLDVECSAVQINVAEAEEICDRAKDRQVLHASQWRVREGAGALASVEPSSIRQEIQTAIHGWARESLLKPSQSNMAQHQQLHSNSGEPDLKADAHPATRPPMDIAVKGSRTQGWAVKLATAAQYQSDAFTKADAYETEHLEITDIGFSRLSDRKQKENAPRLVVVSSTTTKWENALDIDHIGGISSAPPQTGKPSAALTATDRAVGYLLSAPVGSSVDLNALIDEYQSSAIERFNASGVAISLKSYIQERNVNVALAVMQIEAEEARHLCDWAASSRVLNAITDESTQPGIRQNVLSAIHQWADQSLRSMSTEARRDRKAEHTHEASATSKPIEIEAVFEDRVQGAHEEIPSAPMSLIQQARKNRSARPY